MEFGADLVFVMNLDGSVDGGMIHNPARKWFIGIGPQIEVDAQSGGDFGEVVVGGLDRREASGAFQTMNARGESRLREQRRSVAILRGAPGVQRLRHGPEHFAQSRRLGGRQADGPDHLLFVETDQFPDGHRGAEHSRRAGNVPADIVVRGIDRIADPRFSLEPQDEGVYEISASYLVGAGISEQRGRHGRTRVNVVLRRGVVVIVDVRADSVHQRSVQRIGALGTAQNIRDGRTEKWGERAHCNVYCSVGTAAECAAGVIHDRP